MKNREWLLYLSPKERKEFIYNADKYELEEGYEDPWLDEENDTFCDFIDTFTWEDTPQGFRYWSDICDEERTNYYEDNFSNIYVNIVTSVVDKNKCFPELLKPLLCI